MRKIDQSFDGTFTDNIKSSTYKSQFSSKRNVPVINVSGTTSISILETQYAVVKHVAKKNKFNLIADPLTNMNFDLAWIDGITKIDIFTRMNCYQKINHFPGMGILSRKNNLGKNLTLFRRKFPDDYDFFPITWHLPEDFADLKAYHQCRQQGKAQTFIVKPQASCQGRGIYLTRNIQKLKFNEKYVVQRYLHKPYLIDGLKFDLRIYVLITGLDPLRIFVFEEGLARFATDEYKPPRSQNLENLFMHLTNYAINKNSEKFIFNQSINEMNVGHKRSLTSVFKHIEAEGHDVELLKQKIHEIFIKTLITGYPTLSQTMASIHPDNHGNDMCFEILGFDIMLDYKLNPYILQINYTPSFTADTPLDRYIKKRLIADTLNLVGVNEKWKKQNKIRRDKEIQERMLSGKRKKYTVEERKIIMKEQAKKRNQYQKNNLGSFKKIFILNEDQFLEYKKYYDFAMEVYENLGTTEEYPIWPKPTNNPVVLYNNYFSSSSESNLQTLKQKKSKDRQILKNDSQFIRESKFYDSNFCQRSTNLSAGGRQASNSVKRVSSAKGKNEKKERKVIYEYVQSKKSLKVERSKEKTEKSTEAMENSSIFQNKIIENLLMKQNSKKSNLSDQYEIEKVY